jgi:glyoxylase-like metal-dependent hydrolase (beta-lactamase superfamily II)
MHATLQSLRDRSADAGDIELLTRSTPEPGEIREIAKGLLWLRLPLPFVLNHVNCWLLEDADGWTIVDTGADKPESRKIWDQVLKTRLGGKPVKQLVCTHGHPDHIGLAGWLCEKLDVPLVMTLAEWLAPQLWREQGMKPLDDQAIRHFARNGVSQSVIDKLAKSHMSAPFRNHPLPMSFKRIRDGESLKLGRRNWKVLVNGGHADEHASFHSAAAKTLIAGDQILSKISPVVGIFTSQPWSDPLADYQKSLKRLARLPADTLVLPSHGIPFHGLHARIRQLEAHHEERLDRLEALLAREPKSGVELAGGLFARAVAEGQLMMALAETLAHANRLVAEGRAVRTETKTTIRYARA